MTPIIYSTPSCSPCRVLRHLLNKKNIPFEVRDITELKYLNELRKYTDLNTVPITIIDGRVITGTQVSKIEKAYHETVQGDPDVQNA